MTRQRVFVAWKAKLMARLTRAGAVVWGALAACSGGQPDSTNHEARLTALEAKVQALSKLADEEQTAALAASALFDITCPVPWQPLGAAGPAVWSCRADRPSAGGLWPNCTVTLGPAAPNTTLDQYFAESLAGVPQLKAARRLSERRGTLAAAPAYEVVYEHDLLGKPLRVLATLASLGERVYAVSCSAAPEAFADHVATFSSITQSFRPKP